MNEVDAMNGNFNKILAKALDEEHKREHLMSDIDWQKAINDIEDCAEIANRNYEYDREQGLLQAREILIEAQPVQSEKLTDAEQRIFLTAMGREEKVCKEIDEKNPNEEQYEDSLVYVCKEIERKVKGALWT